MAKRRPSGRNKASAKISVKQQSRRSQPVAVGGVLIRCRDCLQELYYNPSSDAEALECIFCGHRSTRPSEDFLSQAATYKNMESRNAKLAVIPAMLGAIFFVLFIFMSGSKAVVLEEDALMLYGPLGGAFICFFLALILGVRYEGNRWEAFF